MKQATVVLVLYVLLAVPALAISVAQSSITAADFEVYRDSAYGFTFWYPKTWLSVPSTHSSTRIKVVSDNGLGEEDCSCGVNYTEAITNLCGRRNA